MFSDTPRPAAAPATRPATRFSREKPIPKGRSRPRKRERRGGIVSFRCRSLGLGTAFEGVGNSAGIGGELDAVQVAWFRCKSSGQGDPLFHSPGELVDVGAFKSR